MKLSEAREFIDRLYNSEDGMTDDMREDLRRLHDSEDEQEGMEHYWKEMSDKWTEFPMRLRILSVIMLPAF